MACLLGVLCAGIIDAVSSVEAGREQLVHGDVRTVESRGAHAVLHLFTPPLRPCAQVEEPATCATPTLS